MVLHIMIKNFGKVESADIALNDLVVFVGNNNSGKTMVMQLIYGIREKLRNFPVTDTGVKKSDLNGQYLIRCAQDWFRAIEVQINDYLAELTLGYAAHKICRLSTLQRYPHLAWRKCKVL